MRFVHCREKKVPNTNACRRNMLGLNLITAMIEGFWQQDGAMVHRTKRILKYLDVPFNKRMLAMESNQVHVWQPRSPDLKPFDLFC